MNKLALKKKTVAKARASHAKRGKRRSRAHLLDGIIKAASDEFKRFGFAGATTGAIARKADVTEAQIFRYFGSKSNLFRETIFKPLDQLLLNFINRQPARGRKGSDIREGNQRYTTELQRFITEHAETLTLLMVTQKYDNGGAHGVGEINSLSSYFEHGAASIECRLTGKPKVHPKLMVRVAFASVLGCVMFRNWIFPRGLANDEEITAAINDFVMEGISSNYAR